MTYARPSTMLAIILAGGLIGVSPTQGFQDIAEAAQDGGLYEREAEPDNDAPQEMPDALADLDAVPIGERFDLDETPSVYKFHTQTPGMLTLVIAARGGTPSLSIETDSGQMLVDMGFNDRVPNEVQRQQRVQLANEIQGQNLGMTALSPDGSNVAYTLLLPSAGSYKLTFAASPSDDDEQPFAAVQWLALPTPEEQRAQGGVAPPPQALDADAILKQATPVQPGEMQTLDQFDAQGNHWLLFEADQGGMLVLATRSENSDVRLSLHQPTNPSEALLYLDSDRNGELGNEATVLSVTAGQKLLVCVAALGQGDDQAVRFQAAFVPDPPAEDADE